MRPWISEYQRRTCSNMSLLSPYGLIGRWGKVSSIGMRSGTPKVALGQKPHVEIYGTDYPTPDGTCIRDYIHILDLAQAHMLALTAPHSAKYNLGTGGGTSVREIIATCEKVTGKKIAVIEKPRRAGDPPRLIAGSEKVRAELGWKPQFQNVEKIIASAWAWHVKHPHGYGD